MVKRVSMKTILIAAMMTGLATSPVIAETEVPAACPATPIEVVRSRGGFNDNYGSVPNIPDLCHIKRSADAGDFYYGIWKTDWPGAGDAYPAIKAVILGGPNARASFITRSIPGMQWTDTFINEGFEHMDVDGHPYTALRIVHERNGIEGNTYHSLITTWRDVKTGVALQTYEQQISGQSYGPDTTWHAVKVLPILPKSTPSS